MKVINTITAICLALMLLEAIFIALRLFSKDHYDRIAYIRSFKKGRCFFIYLIAIALYVMGKMYAGKPFFEALFTSINNVVILVVLRYDPNNVKELINDNSFYEITIYICYIFVTINAVMFILSVWNQQVWQFFGNLRFKLSKHYKYIIIGNNSDNYSIYSSIPSKAKLLVDNAGKNSKTDGTELYRRQINYDLLSQSSWKNLADYCLKKPFYTKYTIIINTQQDDTNIKICNQFLQALQTLNEKTQDSLRAPLFQKLDIFVFGSANLESLYLDLADKSFGCIHYITKHKMMAFDFADNHPFAKYMDDRHIDYSTALVKHDVDINVAILGFGKANQEVLKMNVVNNQFVTGTPQNPVLKQVNYYVFDKDKKYNKNLNHSFFRYDIEFEDVSKTAKSKYLPLPESPANIVFEDGFDICKKDFYAKLYDIVKTQQGKQKVNFILLALGNDIENIDFAKKLLEKKVEWQVDNLVIFVKLKNDSIAKTFKDALALQNCYIYGEDVRTVFNIDKIEKEKFYTMALQRHISYSIEKALKSNQNTSVDIQKVKENAIYDWNINLSYAERMSNIYCCLSLRSKLLLMGLDYSKTSEKNAYTEQTYFDKYFDGETPDIYDITKGQKPLIKYSLDFPVSKRRSLAILEHYRWNAFMIMQGFVPSTIEQILAEEQNGKNYAQRRHGNLTTFEGLIQFRKLVAQKTGLVEEACDVFKYDYQILDDAWWFLDKCGYSIIDK